MPSSLTDLQKLWASQGKRGERFHADEAIEMACALVERYEIALHRIADEKDKACAAIATEALGSGSERVKTP
jgi:hypothetical protein